jgi:hypothetical protein
MRAYADVLSGNEAVREATMFRAVVVTPARAGMVQPDATLLVETDTSASAQALADSAQLAASLERLGASGARVEVLVARNARRIADVAHSQGRLYLFNHFVAHDEEIAVALWEHLAAWYQRETGLDNSMLLAPTEERRSTFNLVNHAAFDLSLPTLARRQFAKRSFFTYVRANLATNAVTAQPVLYRLTHRWSQPRVASALSAERASNQP